MSEGLPPDGRAIGGARVITRIPADRDAIGSHHHRSCPPRTPTGRRASCRRGRQQHRRGPSRGARHDSSSPRPNRLAGCSVKGVPRAHGRILRPLPNPPIRSGRFTVAQCAPAPIRDLVSNSPRLWVTTADLTGRSPRPPSILSRRTLAVRLSREVPSGSSSSRRSPRTGRR